MFLLFIVAKNKLMSVCDESILLVMINFRHNIINVCYKTTIRSSNFGNIMTKFILNNMTDAQQRYLLDGKLLLHILRIKRDDSLLSKSSPPL